MGGAGAEPGLEVEGEVVDVYADGHGHEDCEGAAGGGGALGDDAKGNRGSAGEEGISLAGGGGGMVRGCLPVSELDL